MYAQLYTEVPTAPVHFFLMDLIGNYKPSTKGHQYTLTMIDLLTNNVWCFPLLPKKLMK